MAAEIRTEMPARWGNAAMAKQPPRLLDGTLGESGTHLKKMLREKVEITKQDLQDFFNLRCPHEGTGPEID